MGSPYNADGVFYAQSYTRMADIIDGTSNTVGASERILGARENSTVASRTAINPQTMYVSPSQTDDADCASTLSATNNAQLQGYTWLAGEPRCTSYDHYYVPNDP